MASAQTALQGDVHGPDDRQPPRNTGNGHRRRMRNYLLDRGLQLRYVVVVTLISVTIAGFLGYFVWYQASYASRKILETLAKPEMSWLGREMADEIARRLHRSDANLVLLMSTVGMGLMGVLFLYLILMTHKVAGPLFKLGGYLDQLAEGRLPQVAELRRGDQFRGFFDRFKGMNDSLRQAQAEDVAALDRFLLACEAEGIGPAGELGLKLAELRALKSKKERSLV